MQTHHIVVVSNDEKLSQELTERLTAAGFDVTAGTAEHVTQARIRESRPDLIVLDLPVDTPNNEPYEETIEGDPELRDVPILLCSDDAELLPDRVKGSTQATGPVQASTRSSDEIIAKARWILQRWR